jgi:hypothetical protein
MITILSLVGVAVLLVLLVVSAKMQLDARAARKQTEARAHSGEAEAQHERSVRRRDLARASHAERAHTTASDVDD